MISITFWFAVLVKIVNIIIKLYLVFIPNKWQLGINTKKCKTICNAWGCCKFGFAILVKLYNTYITIT